MALRVSRQIPMNLFVAHLEIFFQSNTLQKSQTGIAAALL